MTRKLVDPFIPVQPSRPKVGRQQQLGPPSTAGPTDKLARPAKPASAGTSMDVMQPTGSRGYRPPAGPLHAQYHARTIPQSQAGGRASTQPLSAAVPAPKTSVKPSPSPTAQKQAKASQPERVSTWALLAAICIIGLSIFWVQFGQLAIAAYALVALWRRWPSRQTFILALLMFGGIVVTSIVPAFRYLMDNFSIYAFLLLAVGTISLALESRRDIRQATAD